MELKRAKRTFNRVVLSLVFVLLGILILSYFLTKSPSLQIYTGQFFLDQPPLLIALVFSLIGTGIIFLIARHH
jgi:high-affinity Fe2+/Pb2+ permease